MRREATASATRRVRRSGGRAGALCARAQIASRRGVGLDSSNQVRAVLAQHDFDELPQIGQALARRPVPLWRAHRLRQPDRPRAARRHAVCRTQRGVPGPIRAARLRHAQVARGFERAGRPQFLSDDPVNHGADRRVTGSAVRRPRTRPPRPQTSSSYGRCLRRFFHIAARSPPRSDD